LPGLLAPDRKAAVPPDAPAHQHVMALLWPAPFVTARRNSREQLRLRLGNPLENRDPTLLDPLNRDAQIRAQFGVGAALKGREQKLLIGLAQPHTGAS